MAKPPNSPDPQRLRGLAPSLITVAPSTCVHRIYRGGGDYPVLWNAFRHHGPTTTARFDHHLRDADNKPQPQARGILYLASDVPTAVAEVFQATRTFDPSEDCRWLVSFEIAHQLTDRLALLNLTDTFPLQAGGSMKLINGPTLDAQNCHAAFTTPTNKFTGFTIRRR